MDNARLHLWTVEGTHATESIVLQARPLKTLTEMDAKTSAKSAQSSIVSPDSTPLIPMEMDVMTPARIVQSSIVPPDLCLMIPMVTVVQTHASIPVKALIVSQAKAVLMAHVCQALIPVKDCPAGTLASPVLLETPTALKRIS